MRSPLIDLLFASALGAMMAVGLYALVVGTRVEAAYVPIPSGSILHFNRSTATGCPTGWTEFTAARGAYIVGLTSGGTLATLVGTALSDQENRAAGVHGHNLSDPGHYHGVPIITTTAGSFFALQGPAGTVYNNVGRTMSLVDQIYTNGALGSPPTTGVATGATVVNSTGVSGSNAPYLQLLTCQKS